MDAALLDQLCALARIELSPEERDDFRAKFESLLGFVEVVQSYAGSDDQAPLAMLDQLEPRRDVAVQFEWPAGTFHYYRVPQVIAFTNDEDAG
jgi:Asp-tRNA(Asn)/Glu-tRNA(Gln) amidotransferase C subunit